jgi:6-pyruvoyltetrahydropterin/6-carboxytetrahydropterin synthase
MFYIKKTLEFAAAHVLNLSYDSPCQNLHGHNWKVIIYCKSKHLNKDGMVIDFKTIKNVIIKKFDHQILNEVVHFNPTAENLARYIVECIPYCYKAKVRESENNEVIYELD